MVTNNLVPSRGGLPERRLSRLVVAKASQVRDETQLAALRADATLALGEHIIDGVRDLYQHKQMAASDDPALDMLLSHVVVNTVTSLDRIQRGLFSGWDL